MPVLARMGVNETAAYRSFVLNFLKAETYHGLNLQGMYADSSDIPAEAIVDEEEREQWLPHATGTTTAAAKVRWRVTES